MTDAGPVAHIGVLVADLDSSRERWSRVLGVFSPITRYQPLNWSDLGNPEPHLHDARLTFYLGDHPSIEILEFVGNGTHSPTKGEGGHHIAFPPVSDNQAKRDQLAALGIGTDGEIRYVGRWIFQFSDARELDNVYTEWVEEHPGHRDVKDDGSPVNRLADGSKTLFELADLEAVGWRRPDSHIVEVGVTVADLDTARHRWSHVTGYIFVDDGDNEAISTNHLPTIRLTQAQHDQRLGLNHAVIETNDIDAIEAHLLRHHVPFTHRTSQPDPAQAETHVYPGYLNNLSLRFRAS